MSFGNILGQIMQNGLGSQNPGSTRLDTSARNLGTQGGLDGVLGQLQGALGGARASGAGSQLGGLAEMAKSFLGQKQVGGLSGAQLGGLGAAAGALLGGGLEGAARGGALAVLGTIALTALRNAQSGQAGTAAAGALDLAPAQIEAALSPEAEKLMVRAMIAAAKSDGQIDQAEMQKIIGKVGDEGVTAEERAFVMTELAAPLDLAALVADVQGPAQAAEVYAASLFAINVDTDAERQYLRDLAAALNLDAATVAQLHQMTGAPAA